MSKTRSYKLLCPIARGLDRVGDRWTLLILRDLHAGPARFTDLQQGLTGIAANLLTDRLNKLVSDGLAEKAAGPHGATLYKLSSLGRKTANLIFELAMFGSQFPSEKAVVRPGNLRTVAVTLNSAAQRIQVGNVSLQASLIVDDENFTIRAANGIASVAYETAREPEVELRTSYAAFIALSEGELDQRTFMEKHSQMTVFAAGKEQAFASVMQMILGVFQDYSQSK